jgi:hypothetical protein
VGGLNSLSHGWTISNSFRQLSQVLNSFSLRVASSFARRSGQATVFHCGNLRDLRLSGDERPQANDSSGAAINGFRAVTSARHAQSTYRLIEGGV